MVSIGRDFGYGPRSFNVNSFKSQKAESQEGKNSFIKKFEVKPQKNDEYLEENDYFEPEGAENDALEESFLGYDSEYYNPNTPFHRKDKTKFKKDSFVHEK